MNKNLFLIIGLVVVVIIIMAFYVHSTNSKENNIKIGFMAPLTGPYAEWGESLKNGMILSLEDVNNNYLVDYQDSQCDPQIATTILKKYIADGINVVVGPGCLSELKAISPISAENNVIIISTGLVDDSAYDDKYVMNFASQISTETKYLSKFISEDKLIQKVAIVYADTSHGQEFSRTMKENLEKKDLVVTNMEMTSQSTTDFKTLILKITQQNPDAIVLHQSELGIASFAKQLRESGNNIPIWGYYGTEAQGILDLGEDAVEGVYYTYPLNSSDQSLKKENFDKRYFHVFDVIPKASTYFVYDGFKTLDIALSKCSVDVDCIINFYNDYTYVGLSGDMFFYDYGRIDRPFGLKKIDNGRFVWVNK